MELKLETIKSYCKKNNLIFYKFTTEKTIDKIYKLFTENIESTIDVDDDDCIYSFYGQYTAYIIKNNEKAIIYLKMAMNYGDITAYSAIGQSYETLKDYKNMKKYYILGINNGCTYCIDCLANYYFLIKKKIDKAKQYYNMACDKGSTDAMSALTGIYFYENNFTEMEKYNDMALDKGCLDGLIYMASYFRKEKKYEEMLKYCELGIKNNDNKMLHFVGLHYLDIGEIEKGLINFIYILNNSPSELMKEIVINSINGVLYEHRIYKLLEMCKSYLDERNSTIYNKIKKRR